MAQTAVPFEGHWSHKTGLTVQKCTIQLFNCPPQGRPLLLQDHFSHRGQDEIWYMKNLIWPLCFFIADGVAYKYKYRKRDFCIKFSFFPNHFFSSVGFLQAQGIGLISD